MDDNAAILLEAKKSLAELMLSNDKEFNCRYIYDHLGNMDTLSVHSILNELVVPCLGDKRAFSMAIRVLGVLFDSSNQYNFAWTKPLQDRMTRFFVKFMAAVKGNPEDSNKVSELYQLYATKLIDNGYANSVEDVNHAYYDYAESLLKMARNAVIDASFVGSVPEYSDPILHDFEEIFALKSSEMDIAHKFIDWLPYKHERPFLFHCAIFAIKSQLWNKSTGNMEVIEHIFEKARKIMEACCWPISDEEYVSFDTNSLNALHEFELLDIFNEALFHDLAGNSQNKFNFESEENLPIMEARFSTRLIFDFLVEQFPLTIAELFGDKETYWKEVESNGKNNSQAQFTEDVADAAIECLTSFFDTINKFLNLVTMKKHWDNEKLEAIRENMQSLNKWLEVFIKIRIFFTSDSDGQIFDQLCESFNELLRFNNVIQIDTIIENVMSRKTGNKLDANEKSASVVFMDEQTTSINTEVDDGSLFSVPIDGSQPKSVRGALAVRGSLKNSIVKVMENRSKQINAKDSD